VYDLEHDLGIPRRFVGLERYVFFTFDRNRVLTTTGAMMPSLAICGFCPHVYSHDGAWRLEGKLLAGCVDARREGVDSLLLPRAAARDGHVRVKLANLAPEVEYIDEVLLCAVPLRDGDELDVGADGRPYVWTPAAEIVVRKQLPPRIDLSGRATGRVLVLEIRNTYEFEVAMRDYLLRGNRPAVDANLVVSFDDGTRAIVPAVGTKFLRRVVVPVPTSAVSARVEAPSPYWQLRRLWTGMGFIAEQETTWRRVAAATAPEAVDLLRDRDRQRLRLGPMESVEVVFDAPPSGAGRRWGYVLRMTGYYELGDDTVAGSSDLSP
jgi:hypothetical protein